MSIEKTFPNNTATETRATLIPRGGRGRGARFNDPEAHLVGLHWRPPLDEVSLAVERVKPARVDPQALEHTRNLHIDLLRDAADLDLDVPASVLRLDLPLVRDLGIKNILHQMLRFEITP
jgi:hypothetical protein